MNEGSIKTQLCEIINRIIEKISSKNWSKDYIVRLRDLLDEVDRPCVVALAGEVSSGKSSLLNAILGGDYAKTAVTETTALLTYFKYGNPSNDRQVKVVYDNGTHTFGDISLLKEGHGNNEDLLDSSINFVEAEIDCEILKDVVFVDTPGTGSTLDVHNENLLKIINSNNEKSLTSYKKADALLYLFNYFAKKKNEETIADFQSTIGRGKHPVNVLGVVNKIDSDKRILDNPLRFTSKIEKSFAGELNHVTAVSSQMYLAIKGMSNRRLVEIKRKLSNLNEDDFAYLTDSQSFFEEEDEELDDLLDIKYRRRICNEFGEGRKYNWTVFKNMMTFIYSYQGTKSKLKESLIEYSRFKMLMDNLKINILDRSKLIVYYRVTDKLKEIINSESFRSKRKRVKAEKDLLERKKKFLHFLSGFKRPVALDLTEFVKHSAELVYPKSRSMTWIEDVSNEIDSLIDTMNVLNIDVLAEKVFKEKYDELKEEEQQELKILFGVRGESMRRRLTIFQEQNVDFAERVRYWEVIKERTKIGSLTRKLSSLAVDSYLIMMDIKNRESNEYINN